MSFIGEVVLTADVNEPPGWMWCDGRELQIRDHRELFALIGPTFGGDGQTRFKVPTIPNEKIETAAGRPVELRYAICHQGDWPVRA